MNDDDQTAVVALLGAPSTHGGAAVERIDTHISAVFLAGSRAWKLKRAVRFDYVDASTPGRRKALCEKEVQLNRRTAPSLYRGVVAVTRENDGSLALGGSGSPVDWVVEMNRFDDDALFDRLAERGRLEWSMMAPLAAAIARFHAAAEPRRDHGGAAGMTWVIDGNARGFAEFGAGALDAGVAARVTEESRRRLDDGAALLDARRDGGFVRQCHGDLHLRNIVLYDGQPMLFDAIDFNDELACVDVLYDLAFLLMDLWRRNLPAHANAVWNRYLLDTGDVGGIALLPLFLSCRAAIRAKTTATALRVQANSARTPELEKMAREYLAMAERLLHPPAPCLAAIGGLSGTGKSTVARALAPVLGPVPGAIVLRTDEIRKQICGVPTLSPLGPEGYTAAITETVYATAAERANQALRSRHSVIVDAVFGREEQRRAVEEAARRADVPFVGLWLSAPVDTLQDRLRRRQHDASDADAAVLQTQLTRETGTISWPTVDAARPSESVVADALSFMRGYVNDAARSG
jgi:aminoglycoside phosphotransferase family enzyme/predicted kinase